MVHTARQDITNTKISNIQKKKKTHSLADWEKPVKMGTLYVSTHTCQMLMNFLPSFWGPLEPRDAGKMAWNSFKGASLLHTGFVRQAVDSVRSVCSGMKLISRCTNT